MKCLYCNSELIIIGSEDTEDFISGINQECTSLVCENSNCKVIIKIYKDLEN